VQVLEIAMKNAVGIAAAASGLRQATLDHTFRGAEESSKELFSPKHQ
jgi:hypothetical protein